MGAGESMGLWVKLEKKWGAAEAGMGRSCLRAAKKALCFKNTLLSIALVAVNQNLLIRALISI